MKKIIVFVCVLFLGGCSAKFAYNNASWLVYWYLDDYINLSNEQEDMFDTMFEGWMDWHKQKELPLYQSQLEDIISDIKTSNINEQTISVHRERARQHWVRARIHVAPDLVKLGSTLSEKQVDDLFNNLEKENINDEEEIEENAGLSDEKKVEKWIKRNQKNIKKWTGKLDGEQENFISSYYDRFESTRQYWIDYKREYQQQLRNVFASSERDQAFEQKLYDLIVDPEKYRSQNFQSVIDLNAQASTEYLLGLFALSSEKQRQKLVDEIDEYRGDLISLQK